MFFNDFFNLVLVCKDTEQMYGRTKTGGFSYTVFYMYFIHKFFKAFNNKILKLALYQENFRKTVHSIHCVT